MTGGLYHSGLKTQVSMYIHIKFTQGIANHAVQDNLFVMFLCASFSQCVQLFSSFQLFDKLRSQQADFTKTVHSISGDICEANLGLTPDDLAVLEQNVNIIFQCSTCHRYDEPLKYVDLFSILLYIL